MLANTSAEIPDYSLALCKDGSPWEVPFHARLLGLGPGLGGSRESHALRCPGLLKAAA